MIRSLYTATTGARNVHRETYKKGKTENVPSGAWNQTSANSQKKKDKSVVWEQLRKLTEGPLSISRITAHTHTQKKGKKMSHTVFGGGFAKELTAEPQWAKCSKRWSLSGQVPPLVPVAKKQKLNLLSAPLKLVSQDPELSVSHPSPQQGPKGDSPKERGSEQFAFTLQTIKAQQSRCDSPHTHTLFSLYHNCHPHEMQESHGAAITVPFKREKKLAKSKC